MLPQSPIKILAGLKLYGKNPKVAPTNIKENCAMCTLLSIKDDTKKTIEIIDEIPHARPSMLSKRFIELVITTIQIIVINIDNAGFVMNSIFMPEITIMQAEMI